MSRNPEFAASSAGSLAGRTAVVTGGGRGIGAAIAMQLAAAGASVVIAARTRGEVESVAENLRGSGARALGLPCDVSDPEAVSNLARIASESFGDVDILVNNAGVAFAPIHRTSLEDWNRLLAVNANGSLRVRADVSAGDARTPTGSRRERRLDRGTCRGSVYLRLRRFEARARGADAGSGGRNRRARRDGQRRVPPAMSPRR